MAQPSVDQSPGVQPPQAQPSGERPFEEQSSGGQPSAGQPSKEEPSLDTPSAISDKLWDDAYDKVQADDPSLVENYEKIITMELAAARTNDGTAAIVAPGSQPRELKSNEISQNDKEVRRRQMAALVTTRIDSSEKRGTAKNVLVGSINIVTQAKAIIGSALAACPAAGLAFSGVCLVLEVGH